jgi:hypothetical protein
VELIVAFIESRLNALLEVPICLPHSRAALPLRLSSASISTLWSQSNGPALRFCMRAVCAFRTAVLMEGLLSLQYRWQLVMTQCTRAIIRQLTVLFSAQFAVIFKLTPTTLCAAARCRNPTII